MPRYDYEPIDGRCDDCGGRFEVFQPMSDAPLAECPMCDKPVRRLIALPNVKTTRSNAELRDRGFTKLVKRSDGTYENVTRRGGEPRTIDPRKLPPGTS